MIKDTITPNPKLFLSKGRGNWQEFFNSEAIDVMIIGDCQWARQKLVDVDVGLPQHKA